MKIERFWPRAAGAMAIVALVLVTNEGYRRARALVDEVGQSKSDIALLKRDLYVLQVQLDTQPKSQRGPILAVAPEVMSATFPTPLAFPPLPAPMGQSLGLPDDPVRQRPKPRFGDEPKSLVSVVLMGDLKAPAAPAAPASSAGTKAPEGPKFNVRLIGDPK